MERKSILWLSHLLPFPPKGGVLQRSFNLLREVSRYHDVHLLAFEQEGLLALHYDSVSKGVEQTTKNLSPYCESITSVPMPLSGFPYAKPLIALKSLVGPYPYTLNWLNSSAYRNQIESLIQRESFDLIYCDTISLALYHHSFDRIPYVIGHHNIESDMMFRRAENESGFLKKIYFWQEAKKIERYEKKFCTDARLNITCSSLDSERLRKIVPDTNVSEAPNGVDLEYFHSEPRSLTNGKGLKFVFAGRLNAYTNAKAALHLVDTIWPAIKAKFPGSTCFVVGSNPPQRLVDQAKTDDSLVVTGFVDDVREYLRSADVYLCPITDGGGTKLKVLDALAMGIPMVADPIACEGIDVADGETVLFAQSGDDYANQVWKLVQNPELYKAMSAAAIVLIERQYSYESIGEKLSLAFFDACA